MINGDDFTKIIDNFEPEQLEVDYGGKNDFKYITDEHWNKEEKVEDIPIASPFAKQKSSSSSSHKESSSKKEKSSDNELLD